MENETLAACAVWSAVVCGLAGAVLPTLFPRSRRKAAANCAGALALAGTASFAVSSASMPAHYAIRWDLVVIPILLLLAWAQWASLTFRAPPPEEGQGDL